MYYNFSGYLIWKCWRMIYPPELLLQATSILVAPQRWSESHDFLWYLLLLHWEFLYKQLRNYRSFWTDWFRHMHKTHMHMRTYDKCALIWQTSVWHASVCLCACALLCACIRLCACMRLCASVCASVYMCVRTYLCVCVCVRCRALHSIWLVIYTNCSTDNWITWNHWPTLDLSVRSSRVTCTTSVSFI